VKQLVNLAVAACTIVGAYTIGKWAYGKVKGS
jgi:hypothetical protein